MTQVGSHLGVGRGAVVMVEGRVPERTRHHRLDWRADPADSLNGIEG